MRKIRFVLWILAPFLMASCASCIKRQECDKVNWYEYGQKIAMKGLRPGADTLVQDCRKVEADVKEADLDRGFKEGMNQYCRPETVFVTGKDGQDFNTDFCDPGQLTFLRQQYKKGINEYCLPDSGYQVGAVGKTYTKVCTAEQEKVFLPQYKKGRKKYLELMVVETQSQISEKDFEQHQLSSQASTLSIRLTTLPRARQITERRWDDLTKSYREETRTDDPYSGQRQSLNMELDGVNRRIQANNTARLKLQQDLVDYRKELVILGE